MKINDHILRFVAVIGIVVLITAVLNFCPLYALLGINTSVNDKEL